MKYPKITSAFLNLTNSCNLACRYCFVHQNPKQMTLQTAKDAADWLASNADGKEEPLINFFGGEPLLMWESIVKPLTEYIRGKYGKRFTLSMTSNCTLMTEEIAKFLHENDVSLLLSMDGDKKTQDWNRPLKNGESCFETLEKNLDTILRYWPTVTFRSTITANTANQLFHNMMFAETRGFKNYFAMPNCFEEWKDADVETLKKQIALYSDHYVDCLQRGTVPIIFGDIEKMFRSIVLRNAAIENGDRRTSNGCKSCGKCGLGSAKFAGININGDVVTCQEFFSSDDAHFTIGNIYTEIDDQKREQLQKEWDEKEFSGDCCKDCPIDRICDGGCLANNYLAGDEHVVPTVFCQWRRILFDAAVYIMTELGNSKCEAFKTRWQNYVR